ncbi:hypothetical protein SAMN04487868_111130 [Marinobacter salarius]|jgi:hypothetical protein|uniref:Uncharacterized protein n=1 Tax=Marinobacter salarius TaxID=1420917 RepID=A0ABY1FQ56_9GAMM|nr:MULTISPECIES: hypothetical protein [Marinobacter]PHS01160.1 MAG: hypothetical protein COA80_02400 [Leeuwenhoekiella sp.]SFL83126.1 hypothetical protein SAMN04487868_111130 [Marinobacter salarius]|tara:strand:+ start:6898 stop:7653 length:756 start_codon:yes stop_codon:yes gene_type:complete
MARVKPSSFRTQRSADLRHLASLLERYGVCLDTGPIQSAADQCSRNKPHGHDSWGYRIDRLIFRDLEKPKSSWPKSISDLSIEFNIEISGWCLPTDHCEDPFETLAMDIIIRGRTLGGALVMCAWHLDRHIGKHVSKDASPAHPHYHFQHGGNRLNNEIKESGQALIIEAPRIAHPPLEATLGVDFILSNFKSKDWARISEDHQYRNIVRQTQNHCWSSYVHAISTALPIQGNVQQSTNKLISRELWPQLL